MVLNSRIKNMNKGIRKSIVIAMAFCLTTCKQSPSPVTQAPSGVLKTPIISITTTNTFSPNPTIEGVFASPTSAPTVAHDSNELEIQMNNSDFPVFVPQMGTPVAMLNFAYGDLGCNWMGIGGQIFNDNDQPVSGLIVEVNGMLNGQDFLGLDLTGNSPVIGEGGYLIILANSPYETQGHLWLEVMDIYGVKLSNKIFFDTYQDCSKNFILLNFVATTDINNINYYFPLIIN